MNRSLPWTLAVAALAACTRPAPTVDADARFTVDSAANSQPDRDASAATRTAPIALARSADRAVLALVRVASRREDEEIRPTLGALGASVSSVAASTALPAPSRLIERTPEHRVFNARPDGASDVALDPRTGSWLVLDSRELVALPLDETASPLALSRAGWGPVDSSLATLVRRTIGRGDSARAIDPRTIVTSAAGPAAAFVTCADGEHRWAGRPCSAHVVTTDASIESAAEPALAARARDATTAILRPRCPRAADVLRCPLEAVMFAGAAPVVRPLGWLNFDAIEGAAAPGWSQLVPYDDTMLAAWSARDNAQGAPRFSLRLARYEPAGRRWTALPPIPSESPATARAIGATPLAVLWSERDEPARTNLSTLDGARWTTTQLAPFAGTLVDAMIESPPSGPPTLWLLVEHADGDAELRRYSGGSAGESLVLRAN